ncbi:MAG: site-specific DNA-methyltransferase [Elusimicrobiaceae bacterium]|nr:site-specific DNA-methyltransferase [Elusimicrobiaceae bacterium]MBT3955095.1 site-specific DNA-methyltransferase [Elusimicrobiaceae bacterium]MBT4008237.1 site-specific DNA-methyltransferase [Elusimicrobiaceae bacterium]MBT4402814.1 site-specific DNA-methyltransferase [Elusimicrobiaceae bacterium]MBT4440071.1 site-specific DNA-methyltransferase [Elusimicrobiaceae bacterium]
MEKMLNKHKEGVFDCIFADPPYFLSNNGITCSNGKMVSVNKGKWDESKGILKNHEFNKKWLGLCKKLLKPNGTIWISGTQHVIFSIGYALQELDYEILNCISWEKPNPPPNLSCRYFTHSTEIIIWAKLNKKAKHNFNYSLMREANGGKQMKTVWNIKPPTNGEKKYGKHPTQKPIELIERCILASTKKCDFVFDPFMGSGTTGVACARNGRKFVGAELEKEYFEVAKKRIKEEQK